MRTVELADRCDHCGERFILATRKAFAVCSPCRERAQLGMPTIIPACKWCALPVFPDTGDKDSHDYCGTRTD